MVAEMENLIKMDFGVETICVNEKEKLFLKVENSFYKLVWLNELDDNNRIEQFYLLRYELANHLKTYLDSRGENSTFILTSSEEITFAGNTDKLEIQLRTHFSDTIFKGSGHNEMILTMLSDLNILSSHEEGLITKKQSKFLDDLLKNRSVDDEVSYTLTDKDFEIIQFEKTLLNNQSHNSLIDIYKILFNESLSNAEGLKVNLFLNFENIYNAESCDCGFEGCFFEMLKENQKYFFGKNYHDQDGIMDSGKVEYDFDQIWSGLSIKEKACLTFLYKEFQNSILFNLGLLKPNFNLMKYQFLMCYPYQPDSEDDQWVREVSTLSNFFIQFFNN